MNRFIIMFTLTNGRQVQYQAVGYGLTRNKAMAQAMTAAIQEGHKFSVEPKVIVEEYGGPLWDSPSE